MKNRTKVETRRSKSLSPRTKVQSPKQNLSPRNAAPNTAHDAVQDTAPNAANTTEPTTQTPLTGIAGIDIGDKRCHLRLINFDGELIDETQITTRPAPLEKYFRRWPRLRIVIEAGTHSNWIRRTLAALGHEVLVANPRRLRLIAQSYSKNDRNDAWWLAELGRTNPELLSPTEPRSAQSEQHRAWLRSRETMVEARTKLINSLRGLSKSQGLRLGTCGPTQWASKVRAECPGELHPALLPLARLIAALTREIRQLDKQLGQLADKVYPATARMRQVNGVGALTALAYVLALDNDAGRVKRSRQAGALVGLRPKQRDSGQSTPQLGITKCGDKLLRRLLVQSAQYQLGPFGQDSALRQWGLKLAAGTNRRAKRRAVVAVARKLAVLLHVLWSKEADYDPFYGAAPAEAA